MWQFKLRLGVSYTCLLLCQICARYMCRSVVCVGVTYTCLLVALKGARYTCLLVLYTSVTYMYPYIGSQVALFNVHPLVISVGEKDDKYRESTKKYRKIRGKSHGKPWNQQIYAKKEANSGAKRDVTRGIQ